jgi:hypothetical protein
MQPALYADRAVSGLVETRFPLDDGDLGVEAGRQDPTTSLR